MFHNLRFAIFPLLHSPFFRLVFLLQKENPLIFFGILWIFFFFWNSLWKMKLFILEHLWKNKISFKIWNFLEVDIIYLIFWEILEFLFYFFNHSFIYFFIIHSSFHFIIFFLKEIYFFWWWVDSVNSIKHELTQKLMWGFNWGGGGNLAPFSLCFPFFTLLLHSFFFLHCHYSQASSFFLHFHTISCLENHFSRLPNSISSIPQNIFFQILEFLIIFAKPFFFFWNPFSNLHLCISMASSHGPTFLTFNGKKYHPSLEWNDEEGLLQDLKSQLHTHPKRISRWAHFLLFFFFLLLVNLLISRFVENIMMGHCHFVVCFCGNLGHCMI